MTRHEWLYTCLRPFDQSLIQLVHAELRRHDGDGLTIVDVGGRRSNYTIGLRGQVTITDIQPTAAQAALDLGAQPAILAKRSNVQRYLYDDMTATQLPPASVDLAIAVEVLEHVEQDARFVENVRRVLKPGGVFVMTTPNGDFVPEPFPDHQRHYRKAQLHGLLAQVFESVETRYIVNADRARRWAGQSQRTILAGLSAAPLLWWSYQRERLGFGGVGPHGKRHLLAVARKTSH